MVGEIMQTLPSLIQGQRSLILEIAVAAFIFIEVIATLYGLVARWSLIAEGVHQAQTVMPLPATVVRNISRWYFP